MSSKTTKAAIDAATADAIERASHFTASIRVRNSQRTEEVRSLSIARQVAALMPEALGALGRALVYAVTPEGRAYLVPEDFPDPANPDQREAFMNLVAMAASIGGATHPASNGVTLAGPKPTPAPEAGKAPRDDAGDMPAELRRPAASAADLKALNAKHSGTQPPRMPISSGLKSPQSSVAGTAKAAELISSAAPSNTTTPAGKPVQPKAKAAEPKADSSKESSPMTSKASKNKARTAVKAKTTKAAKPGERSRYDWNSAEEAAAKGTMPKAPDFSAATHERFRPLLKEVVDAAKAGDAAALRKVKINAVSSSPKAVLRYRNLCLKALSAHPGKKSA